jgi:hypothetical protein
MKTIIAIGFLVALTLLSQVTFASGNLKVNILPKVEGRALLEISNNSAQKVEITISNSEGDLVFYHETEAEHTEYNRTFNFSKLEHGNYKMIVNVDGASNEQMLNVGRHGIEVGKIVEKTEPIFSFKNNQLRVSHLNHNQDEMSLHVYQSGSLIWDKEIGNMFALTVGYDLSKLDKGNYQIVFSSGDETYEYDLKRE